MAYDAEDRVAVVATGTTVGVTVTVGDVQVTVRSPLRAGLSSVSDQLTRSAAIRSARRALEVALDELKDAGA